MSVAKPEEFWTEISKSKSISDVLRKTKAERKYLETEYNTIASLKNGFTIYRNYLKANVPLTRKLNRKPLLELMLEELCLTPIQQIEFNQAKILNIKEDKSNLRAIYDKQAYLDIAVKLLDAASYVDNILGLCALTGRRVAEIGATASFEYINQDMVKFTGQLKTKEREDVLPYEIPVLFNADKIIATLAIIRERKPQFINNPILFHNTSKELSIKVKKHFTGLFEGEPKVKDLRAIYALISFNHFRESEKNKRIDRDVYFSRILGHSKDDISTCASYIDFYLD